MSDFLDKLNEKIDLWNYLKKQTKPIYLYGMGDGAQKVLDILDSLNIKVEGIYASDEFVRGHFFRGYKVEKYSDVKSKHGTDFISLLCFGTYLPDVMERIYTMNSECELYAPDVPVVKGNIELFDLEYVRHHAEQFEALYQRLSDRLSKQTLLDVVDYKISGKIGYLKECQVPVEEVFQEIIKPQTDMVYVDLGAYNGDTVSEFLKYIREGEARKIYALEPDARNFKKMLERIEKENIQNINPINGAVWSRNQMVPFSKRGGRNSKVSTTSQTMINAYSVDELLNGEKADVIKFDVEGGELQALLGAKQTIIDYTPSLMLSAYHKNEDLLELSETVLKMNDGYKVYLRHHPYLPAWETNYYFVKR